MQSSVCLSLLSLMTPVLAFASDSHAETSSPMDFVWKLVNFAVLIAVGIYFGKKTVTSGLNQSAQKVLKELTDAQEAQQQAEMELKELQKRLDDFKQESQLFFATAKEQATQEKQRILEDAQTHAEHIRQQAQASIQQEYKKAMHQLKDWMGAELIRQTEEALNQSISQQSIENRIADYLNDIKKTGGLS